jgi:hypothetical protein
VLVTLPARRPDDNQKPKGLNREYQIAAGNAGWPFQFRFAVHAGWSRVPELWTPAFHSPRTLPYESKSNDDIIESTIPRQRYMAMDYHPYGSPANQPG